jgi:hypothetical protein
VDSAVSLLGGSPSTVSTNRVDSLVSVHGGSPSSASTPAADPSPKLIVKQLFDIRTLKMEMVDIARKLTAILNPKSRHHLPTTEKSTTPAVGEEITRYDLEKSTTPAVGEEITRRDPVLEEVEVAGLESRQYLASYFTKCATNYVAVTHKWGAVSNLYDVSSPLRVSPICDLSKLVLMQQLVEHGTVWIDIYDIIQGKVYGKEAEVRSAQVQLMGEVYFYADLVLWVTTARDDQTLALLDDVEVAGDNKIEKIEKVESWAQKESSRLFSWSPPRNGGAFEHWTRAWTYQEIALAKDLHAVSPYTGRDWKCGRILRKVRTIWTIVGKESRQGESKEFEHLRLLIKGALSDLELISQGRSRTVSVMDNKRLGSELKNSRISTRAKDILFTHLWTLGIPKGQLDYSKSVEWNIRQFCAYLISRGQLTIGTNHTAPIANGCWIPSYFFDLLDDDRKQREGDTSFLRRISVRPNGLIIPYKVLDDGRLELKTMVKQLHGEVWIAFLNKLESVVFLKSAENSAYHTIAVTNSNWTGGQSETITFGTTQPELFQLDTTFANNVTETQVVETGANMLHNLKWQDGVGWQSSFDESLDYLMELRAIVDDPDMYAILKSVIATEDAFANFTDCVLYAAECATLEGISEYLVCEAVEILYALCGKYECARDGKSNCQQYLLIAGEDSGVLQNDTNDMPLKIYNIENARIGDICKAFDSINKVRAI